MFYNPEGDSPYDTAAGEKPPLNWIECEDPYAMLRVTFERMKEAIFADVQKSEFSYSLIFLFSYFLIFEEGKKMFLLKKE